MLLLYTVLPTVIERRRIRTQAMRFLSNHPILLNTIYFLNGSIFCVVCIFLETGNRTPYQFFFLLPDILLQDSRHAGCVCVL